jgi:hypothetical protein
MADNQRQKIEALLAKSELDVSSRELMLKFFDSISGQPQFPKIVDLLERFPALFENFCKCFQIKKDFLNQGKTEVEWNDFLSTEKQVLDKLD